MTISFLVALFVDDSFHKMKYLDKNKPVSYIIVYYTLLQTTLQPCFMAKLQQFILIFL